MTSAGFPKFLISLHISFHQKSFFSASPPLSSASPLLTYPVGWAHIAYLEHGSEAGGSASGSNPVSLSPHPPLLMPWGFHSCSNRQGKQRDSGRNGNSEVTLSLVKLVTLYCQGTRTMGALEVVTLTEAGLVIIEFLYPFLPSASLYDLLRSANEGLEKWLGG